jgi:hypothetical protein
MDISDLMTYQQTGNLPQTQTLPMLLKGQLHLHDQLQCWTIKSNIRQDATSPSKIASPA